MYVHFVCIGCKILGENYEIVDDKKTKFSSNFWDVFTIDNNKIYVVWCQIYKNTYVFDTHKPQYKISYFCEWNEKSLLCRGQIWQLLIHVLEFISSFFSEFVHLQIPFTYCPFKEFWYKLDTAFSVAVNLNKRSLGAHKVEITPTTLKAPLQSPNAL